MYMYIYIYIYINKKNVDDPTRKLRVAATVAAYWTVQASPEDRHWEGYHESRRCSSNTYPESYITKYTSTRR